MGKVQNVIRKENSDFMGRPPKFFIRIGPTIVFIILLLLLSGSFIVRYPTTIPCVIMIENSHNNNKGIAYANVYGIGKVKQGQYINIQLDSYPYLDYGLLTGIVTSLPKIDGNNHAQIQFKLKDGLKTSYGRQVTLRGKLTGNGQIITDDNSLAEQIFKPLRYYGAW